MAADLYPSANLLCPFALGIQYSFVPQSFCPSISFLDLVSPLPIWAIPLKGLFLFLMASKVVQPGSCAVVVPHREMK